jgi:hypothetical protein
MPLLLSKPSAFLRLFNNLISCKMGECKNVTKIYECVYANTLLELMEPWGKVRRRGGTWTPPQDPYMTNGFCNCNECMESNTSLVVDVTVSQVHCPKDTRYLLHRPAQ